MRVTRFLAVALFLSTFSGVIARKGAAQTAGAPLTNQDIVALTAAGLPDDVIVAKIHQAPSVAFDTSVAALTNLKTAGVSSGVLRAMIDPKAVSAVAPPSVATVAVASSDPDDPNSPHYGIYVQLKGDDGKMHMTKLRMNAMNDIKGPSIGSSLATAYSFGIHKSKAKTVIAGSKAQTQTKDPSPVFYDYAGDMSVQSLALIRFEVKGNTRSVTSLSMGSIFTGMAKKGPTADEQKSFTAELVKTGVYRLTLNQPLAPGSYAFGTESMGMISAFYDFDILPPQ